MEWSWTVFAVVLPISIIISMFSRGAMNDANVAKHGAKADFRSNPGMSLIGSVVGGAVWSLIITALIGFLL